MRCMKWLNVVFMTLMKWNMYWIQLNDTLDARNAISWMFRSKARVRESFNHANVSGQNSRAVIS